MTTPAVTRSAFHARAEAVPFARRLRTTEAQKAFHDRVLDAVRAFLQDHAMAGKTGAREFYEFEKALHQRMLEAEREILADVMSASDVDADAIEIEGKVHRRVLRGKQTYMTAAGEVEVERWLYKDRSDPTAHALAALDARLGIIEGFWTQRAASQASWVVTQMTPKKGAELWRERHAEREPRAAVRRADADVRSRRDPVARERDLVKRSRAGKAQ